ncbi:PDZ domain-containing protein [Sphingomonas yabuuchiae]|uniref:PDZ domain-containing protein n=1 Tax=Sphingomonas yabuuchiae TaxID=172044 RepID=UPI001F8C9C21|nr:PDZ domain-containing protein [uncultured Sphingomonas sp.]HIV79110.1 PDZ domain-containing protein [Candidatus Sphingomonas excrementigallinarum]
MKSLRIVGWSAGMAALIGGAAFALLVGHMPLHAGPHRPSTLYGATFAPVAEGRPGLVVTSLRSDVDDDSAALVRPPLHVGDTVLSVDGHPATSFALLRDEAALATDTPMRLQVARDHGLLTITLLRSGAGGQRGQQDFADRR